MKKRIPIAFIFAYLLASCMNVFTPGLGTPSNSAPFSQSTSSTTPTISNLPSTTPISIPTVTLLPQVTATKVIVEFPTPATRSAVRQQCLTIEDALPKEMTLMGALVLDTSLFSLFRIEGDMFLMNLRNHDTLPLPRTQGQVDLGINGYAVSPNRKWFAYIEPSATDVRGRLHVISADGQDQPVVARWDNAWGQIEGWLDDQQLILRPSVSRLDDVGTIMVLNPFTGEWKKLSPDFARGINIDVKLIPPVFYNTSLTRVIYLSGQYLVLWDIQSQKELWRKPGGNFTVMPEWSPDGSRFAMVIYELNPQTNFIHDELYMVDQDGRETQLTRLSDSYSSMPEIHIERLEWSPDGHYIALLLDVQDDVHEYKKWNLVVVDVATKQVTDYCISAKSNPVWSPNGEQLVVTTPIDYGEYKMAVDSGKIPHVRVVLIDVGGQFAVQLANDIIPVGWMILP